MAALVEMVEGAFQTVDLENWSTYHIKISWLEKSERMFSGHIGWRGQRLFRPLF